VEGYWFQLSLSFEESDKIECRGSLGKPPESSMLREEIGKLGMGIDILRRLVEDRKNVLFRDREARRSGHVRVRCGAVYIPLHTPLSLGKKLSEVMQYAMVYIPWQLTECGNPYLRARVA